MSPTASSPGGTHPDVRVVVVYPGRIATDSGANAAGERMEDAGKLSAEVRGVREYVENQVG